MKNKDKYRDKLESDITALIVNKTGQNDLNVIQKIYRELLLDKYDDYKSAKKAINKDGLITVSDGRHGEIKKAHPAISASDLSMKAILLLAKELDIAPNNQSVLETKKSIDNGYDPFKKPGA